MSEMLQMLGAILILGAFALLQFHRASDQSYPYLLLNLIGSTLLAIVVFTSHQWGLLLLEGAWTLIALRSIIARMYATLHIPSHQGNPASCVHNGNGRTATVERRTHGAMERRLIP
jgi:hypothetical protein